MDYKMLAEEFLEIKMKSTHVKMTREIAQMTKPDIFVLLYLKIHDGKAYPKDLSSEFRVSSARIAVLLNKLESDGYVERKPDENDNRQTVVILSSKGEKLINDKREIVVLKFAKLLELLGPEDAKEYIRLQRKLCEVMKAPF